jgi:hypothetical protein
MSKTKKQTGKPAKDLATLEFHQFISGALTAGALAIQGSPTGLGGRPQSEADGWTLFRLRSMRFRLHAGATRTGNLAVGWVGGVQDLNPATVIQIGELIPSTLLGQTQTTPTNWVDVTKSELAGPAIWYKSIVGGADSWDEAPGYIVVGGTGTDAFTMELYVAIEFKVGLATGNTPKEVALRREVRMLRMQREVDQERTKVLGILSGGSAGNPAFIPSAAIPPTVPKEAGCGMPYLVPALCKVTGCPYHTKP